MKKDNKKATASDIAAALGLTRRHVYTLLENGTIHREKDGSLNLPRAVKEYYAFKYMSDDEADYNKEKAMHERARRKMAEIALAKIEHRMHDARDIELVMSDMITNCKSVLLGIPHKMAPALVGLSDGEIAAALDKEIRDALSYLADYKPTMFDVEPEEDESGAIKPAGKPADAAPEAPYVFDDDDYFNDINADDDGDDDE